jgi:glycosyltransferase involved in cell wall biosynthesis
LDKGVSFTPINYQTRSKSFMIILVSPEAHYPAHNWPNTVALMRALRQKGRNVRAVTFSTTVGPVPPDLQGCVQQVFSRMPPGWKSVGVGKWTERRLRGLMNICETSACLFKALWLTRKQPRPVLHFIGGSYWVVVLATLCFKRVRFVYSLYGSMLSGPADGLKAALRRYLRKLLQSATATGRIEFTCETEFLHEEIKPLLGIRLHHVPAAIDDAGIFPTQEEARRQLGLDLDEKILLYFGTHRKEKDYHTALKGCLLLPNPPLALFVGKVISANDPQRVVAECGYPKVRIVDKFVDETESRVYFAAADVVVLPYEANYTRGSQVLIECCRSLRPILATAAPYFSAFLERFKCGVTYTAGDSNSFAHATRRLLADAAGFRPALEQARHHHSWTVAADRYIELYDLLASG